MIETLKGSNLVMTLIYKLAALFVCISLQTVVEPGNAQKCPSMCSCIWRNNKQTALCANQGLIAIPSGISPNMQVLDLTKNNFQILPSKVFQERGLINLQKIILSECKLGVIAPDAFYQLSNLIELYLSSNLLTSVPTEALKHCPSVRRLLLNGNPIQVIRENSFASLSHLNSLDLSNCQIDLIEPKAFKGLQRLQFLKLDGNRLTTLSSLVVNDLPPLFSFDLHHNAWNCDCELRASIEWMNRYNIPHSIPPTCAKPERLAGSMWNSLDIDDFACTPIILSRETEVTTYSSTNVSFTCTVKALPEAKVSWSVADVGNGNSSYTILPPRTDKFILTEDRSTSGQVSSTLNILNVDVSDGGLSFRCSAENQAGTVTKKFNLTLIPVAYQSLNGWSRMEIAAIVVALILGIVVTCVLLAVCLLRRSHNYASSSETNKAKKANLPQIDVLNTMKTSSVSKSNGTYEEKVIVDSGVGNKTKIDNGSSSTYGYTPDVTANTMNGSVDSSGYNNHGYNGLLQVSPQQHLQNSTHSYSNFENYDLYDYNTEGLNYNYDQSYVTPDMPLAATQNIDPNYWHKHSPMNAGSIQDLSSSQLIHPHNNQHHVNVVGQGSYNIGQPTVVRYSPDEGYAEEPAIIPYNLQGTEV
ncbi:leucine-rich repeat and immunoglobulin-like domain-containing nogo receptor-interacting protein 3 [Dinothrombium tinctorium]|uniref:Leucine-rich repeat and immunoglobulin-like domain-containing nogo receptor-interacting protein 3 n=1 Tax=Dinothrombium tinctorium TaxID=1965070 RepID=A0A3S4RKE2_9ACAR|nr:leucine-rich repeat and immunoglobulin-like domain-containing nogo receptor-interacting protein 3 [Dinothrombium tinctorium]RWS16193.1 leucine-rich repeat and immunoglobulin-like domain-containing nogo receptor-interacting protein 3 [Dinothrombium tinctorium]RWS17244.1 leucine-rich repeat and immunoglobulin-like domain-containing nogo receptor-interacting protein 3 [Dinothrombium tinctorium]